MRRQNPKLRSPSNHPVTPQAGGRNKAESQAPESEFRLRAAAERQLPHRLVNEALQVSSAVQAKRQRVVEVTAAAVVVEGSELPCFYVEKMTAAVH